MNQFASIESSAGLLKDNYDDTTAKALKQRREKMAAKKLGADSMEGETRDDSGMGN